MPRWCYEFVDSRLRRSPPDRASAVPYGQAGENALRFPHLAHRSAAAHKLHSTPQQDRMNLISGNPENSSRLPVFSFIPPRKLSKHPGPSQYLDPDFKVTAPNYLPWGGTHSGAAFFRDEILPKPKELAPPHSITSATMALRALTVDRLIRPPCRCALEPLIAPTNSISRGVCFPNVAIVVGCRARSYAGAPG